MDELAPRIRRSDRPMASLDAGRASDGRRQTPRAFGALEPTDDGNLSLGRRIGVLVVLAALGGAIVLAAGGVGGNNAVGPVGPTGSPQSAIRTPRPVASPPIAAPLISALEEELVNSRSIDLRVTVPEPGTTLSGLEIRIYRNTRLLQSADVSRVGRIKVRDVPLRRGANKLTATLANAGGEGPRSEVISVTLDDREPRITVRTPRTGVTLNQGGATFVGRTEAGLTVIGRNTTSDTKATTVASKSGAFTLSLALDKGRNSITLLTRDAAGNRGTARLVIYRGNGKPTVTLKLSRERVRLAALPINLTATATVRDANGLPIEDARVTFTIAPRGLPADVYTSTTGRDGKATSRYRLIRRGADRGPAVVTAEVVLPGGRTADKTVEFEVR